MADNDKGTTTRARTQQEQAGDTDTTTTRTGPLAEAREVGRLGVSPEAERTGRADKGLSQQNPAILNGGPVPDARPSVDDSEAIRALKG